MGFRIVEWRRRKKKRGAARWGGRRRVKKNEKMVGSWVLRVWTIGLK